MRARARHTHTRTPRIHARERERERMRRISRLDLLPYRSEIVLAVVAGPFLLPRGAGRGRGADRLEGGRSLERWREGRGEAVHYRARKKTIHGTFNFRSPSAASIQGESTAGAWIPSFNRALPSSPLPFPSHEDEKRNLSPLDIVRHGEEEESSTTAPRRGHLRNVEFDYL